MSSGTFSRSKYQADNGDIHPVRIQPETALAVFAPGGPNTAPAAAVDNPTYARVSGGRRRYGLKCRSVRIQFQDPAPDGYAPNSTITLPVLTTAVYNAITPGGTVSYLNSTADIVGKSPEGGR